MQFSLSEIEQKVVDVLIKKYKDRNAPAESIHFPKDSKKAYTNGLGEIDVKLLANTFKQYLVNEEIYKAMVLVEFIPWNIHTDYDKGDDNPGKAILIPAYTQNTNTIVFNEILMTNTAKAMRSLPKVENHVSEELYQKHLTHILWEDAQRVSIKEVFAWEKGKAVTWDRDLLHTSDNFKKNNLDSKIALVIFTKRV